MDWVTDGYRRVDHNANSRTHIVFRNARGSLMTTTCILPPPLTQTFRVCMQRRSYRLEIDEEATKFMQCKFREKTVPGQTILYSEKGGQQHTIWMFQRGDDRYLLPHLFIPYRSRCSRKEMIVTCCRTCLFRTDCDVLERGYLET